MTNLPQNEAPKSLTDLGYDEAAQAKLARIVRSTSRAMIAGATGPGKTTLDVLARALRDAGEARED